MAGLDRMGRGAFTKLSLLLAIMATALAPQSASAVERKLLVSRFENIVVIGDINVTIQTGKSVSGKASGDKRVLDSLKLERTGTTLRIRLQDIINNDKGRPITEPLRVVLTTQQIRDMTVSGNGELMISEVRQPDAARMLIAGGGKITIGRLVSDQFSANIDGNGRIEIDGGLVRDSRVTIVGAGEYQATRLQVRKLRLEHNGNAISSATVEEGTEIYNRGSGNITIGGRGTCFIKLAGAAAINCAKTDANTGK
jgi:Putative auto-transporter adhesin, head GIN domain